MPNLIMAMTWSSPLRKAITSITVTASCITAVAAAAPTVEPFVPAHRAYVRYETEEFTSKLKLAQTEVQRTLMNIQKEQADGKKEAAENDLFKARLELGKATDDQTKQFIGEQVHKLESTIRKLDSQIDTLSRAAQ